MRAVVLRIDVPYEGPRRPLRAHERVLATHEIDVAGPQEFVVPVLVHERHDAGEQVSAPHLGGGCGHGGAQMLQQALRRAHGRHDAGHGVVAAGPGVEEGGDGGVVVTEEAHPQLA